MAGNQGNNRIVWTRDQLKFLRANWETMTARELSLALGINQTSVRLKKYQLGLYLMQLEYWTPAQVRFLKENYKRLGDTEIAEIFNRRWKKAKGWGKKHIEKKRRHLGLKRTPAQIRKIHLRNVELGRFSMCPVKDWKKRGVAKKGELRVWAVNGSQRVFVKTNKGFTPYARWLYRKQVGPVPPGKVVRLIDGDPLNVTVENLMLVTRQENAAMNSRSRTPKEFRQTRELISKLNKTINDNEKQIS